MIRFSIVITCYNQKSLIKEAVDSALGQDYTQREVIVVDDCSTDGSRGLLDAYGDRIKFKALATNAGACAARNRGASLANGDFLVFLDGDDLLLPWALSVYSHIIESRQPKLILGRMIWFRNASSLKEAGVAPERIELVTYDAYMKKDRPWRTSASAIVVERACFNQVNGWTENFFPCEDHDLVLKLGYAGRVAQVLSPQTTAYRVHETNTVHQVQKIMKGVLEVVRREKSGCYPGGIGCRFDRYATVGGVVFYWLKRGLVMKFLGTAWRLFAASWLMIIAAMTRRAAVLLRGRRPVEVLDAGSAWRAATETVR